MSDFLSDCAKISPTNPKIVRQSTNKSEQSAEQLGFRLPPRAEKCEKKCEEKCERKPGYGAEKCGRREAIRGVDCADSVVILV